MGCNRKAVLDSRNSSVVVGVAEAAVETSDCSSGSLGTAASASAAASALDGQSVAALAVQE